MSLLLPAIIIESRLYLLGLTIISLLFNLAPLPTIPVNNSSRLKSYTTPRIGLFPLYRAIEIELKGILLKKLTVPSSGSTIQQNSDFFSIFGLSSDRIEKSVFNK